MNRDKDTDVAKFLNSQGALVVEPSNAFFSVIQSCLVSYGMDSKKIIMANTYKDAVAILKEEKPRILITEYMIGKNFGLSLIDMHDEMYDAFSRIAIVVTKESSDNAVAEAAEEQLDAFIVKPFSGADFQKRFIEVVKRKMYPSEYLNRIRDGKEKIKSKNLPEAVVIFNEAKKLSQTPTLACYYLGECYLNQNELVSARKEFAEGRKYNSLHYKCLTGEFDCLMQEKRYKEAYTLVELIRKHYPVTSVRLGKFFIAAVCTEHFEDMMLFYEMFTNLDYRPPELIGLVSLALLTAGRYNIRNKDLETAIKHFELASNVTGRSVETLEKIIEEWLKIEDINTAERFFKLIRGDDVGSAKHIQLNFKIGVHMITPEAALEMGRKIVVEGNSTPEVTKRVVKLAIDTGKATLAESLIIKGAQAHPEIRKELYDMLEGQSK
ncbi:MAG: hypothetical protein JNM24_05240 [Bdellovibrionaceae bacterium]|nr:hypothetical protein [Pseudobdellovibrionaceae bacterium]